MANFPSYPNEPTEGGKLERSRFVQLIDTSFGGETPAWYVFGEDNEDFSIDLNPDIEQKKNILDENTIEHNGYEPSGDVDTYFARLGDPLFEKLQKFIDTRAKGDSLKTKVLEVHGWTGSATAGYEAFEQGCYVVPQSYGGSTAGYQIPYNIYYIGARTEGTYVPGTSTFTPKAAG